MLTACSAISRASCMSATSFLQRTQGRARQCNARVSHAAAQQVWLFAAPVLATQAESMGSTPSLPLCSSSPEGQARNEVLQLRPRPAQQNLAPPGRRRRRLPVQAHRQRLLQAQQLVLALLLVQGVVIQGVGARQFEQRDARAALQQAGERAGVPSGRMSGTELSHGERLTW